ncbi:MAG: ArsI/CadI family heavy metal resistance metalloenzyme [Parvularculaceae bacterium]
MKRFHAHITVDDIGAARKFYAAMFGAAPTVDKPDYAKWMLDDPRINLAISSRGLRAAGINHLGIEAETQGELDDLERKLTAAEIAMKAEPGARCCYARSNKQWITDPQGIVWEMFHTMGEAAVYGDDQASAVLSPEAAPPGSFNNPSAL